jgi:hypothetical protein
MKKKRYPEPTMSKPDLDQIERWLFDFIGSRSDLIIKATDGCVVEPDGICPHGYPSWLLYLGYI